MNLATSGGYSPWVWVAVAVATLAVFGVSLWTQHSQLAPARPANTDVDLGSLDAGENLRLGKVQSAGGFRVQQATSGKDMEFGDIETGRGGGASHP